MSQQPNPAAPQYPQIAPTPLSQVLPAAVHAYGSAQAPLTVQPRFRDATPPQTIIDGMQGKLASLPQPTAFHPGSPVLNAVTSGQSKDVAHQHPPASVPGVIGSLWNDTVGSVVNYAKANPWQFAAEVAGGVLLTGAIIATGGLAGVALGAVIGAEAGAAVTTGAMAMGGAALAAMTLPGLIKSVQTASQDGWSDQDIAHVVVSGGATLLAAVPATRGLTGLKAAAEASAAEIETVRGMGSGREVVSYLTKNTLRQAIPGQGMLPKAQRAFTSWRGAPAGLWRERVPTGSQLDPFLSKITPSREGDRKIIDRLREADKQAHGLLRNAGLTSVKDLANVSPADTAPIREHLSGEWKEARAEFGKRFGYAVDPLHLPFSPTMAQAEAEVLKPVQKHVDHLFGTMRGVMNFGLHPDNARINLDTTVEGLARGMVGPTNHVGNEMLRSLNDTMEHLLGNTWKDRGAQRMREILWSLEPGTPDFNLTDQEKVAARVIKETLDLTTTGALNRGRLLLEYGDRVPIRRVPSTGRQAGVHAYQASLSSADWAATKNWDVNFTEQELEHGEFSTVPVLDESGEVRELAPQMAPRQTNYQAYQALEARNAKQAGRMPALEKRDVIEKARSEIQPLKSTRTRTSNSLEKLGRNVSERMAQLTALRDEQKRMQFELEALGRGHDVTEQRQALRSYMAGLDKEMTPLAHDLDPRFKNNLRAKYASAKTRLAETEAALAAHKEGLLREHGSAVAEAAHSDAKDWQSVAATRPEDHKLMDPRTMLETELRRFVLDQHKSAYFDQMRTAAQTNLSKYLNDHPEYRAPGSLGVAIRKSLGEDGVKQFVEGSRLAESEFGLTLPASAFRSESDARDAGYAVLHPAIGRKGEINYQEALYAPTHIVKPFRDAVEQARTVDHLPPAMKFLQKWTVNVPRKLIFAVPVVHMFNEVNRAVNLMISDPAVASSSLAKLMHWRFSDPEAYAHFKAQHYLAGGQPFHALDYIPQLTQHLSEETGVQHWPGAIRHVGGAIHDAYYKLAQQTLSKTVEDVGLLAHMMMDARLKASNPLMNEVERGAAAAEFANNIKGTVNPLYMSRVWRHMRGLAIFAPSYQASWLRGLESVAQSVPGGTRLGNLIAHKYPGISPVRLKYMQNQAYREVVRSQAAFTVSSMASTVVAYDLINKMTSGHHIWENEAGRTWDVDLSNIVPPKLDPQTGAIRKTYVTILPGMAQQRDMLNMLGVGHQYGLAHLATDQHFADADALEKGATAAHALLDGISRVAPGKLSTSLQSLIAFTGGVDPALLFRGKVQHVSRAEGLTYLIPQGLEVRQQLQRPEQPFDLNKYLADEGRSLTGLPNINEMGAERPDTITSDQYNEYVQKQQKYQQLNLDAWNSVVTGNTSIQTYLQERFNYIDQSLAAADAIFGPGSPSGALAKARFQLRDKYGLNGDTSSMSRSEYYAKRDAFQNEWEQVLQEAPSDVKAVWWDHYHKQWTDGDYLYWYTGQIKNAIASEIDGQQGQHIRRVEEQAAIMRRDPTVDPADISAFEDEDEVYSAFKQVMNGLSQESAVGALVAAFASPYAQVHILPPGIDPNAVQGSGTYLTQQSLAQAVQGAREAAQTPEAAESGGRVGGGIVPEANQLVEAAAG